MRFGWSVWSVTGPIVVIIKKHNIAMWEIGSRTPYLLLRGWQIFSCLLHNKLRWQVPYLILIVTVGVQAKCFDREYLIVR